MCVVSIDAVLSDVFHFRRVYYFILSCFTISERLHSSTDLDSEYDFDGFVSEDFGENEHSAAALGTGSDVD